ncbi:MAG: hypothetical protein HQL03_06110 [Nitrospirae bacterium]|nr:hypothetical protein [Nitrospirota bacterium]MBF0593250.1 hypothetical protein [Nitrospirota bacterium]
MILKIAILVAALFFIISQLGVSTRRMLRLGVSEAAEKCKTVGMFTTCEPSPTTPPPQTPPPSIHTPEPTPTPKPTHTPEPTPPPTPKPTLPPTPVPTAVPTPVYTPVSTPKLAPIHTPEPQPIPTPKPTHTPKPTPAPKPTHTPKPTPTPHAPEKKPLPPLRFTLTGITDGTSTTDETVNIAGNVNAEGIQSQVNVNNDPVQIDSKGNFSYVVKLKIGNNEIIVTAKDSSGRVETKTYVVVRKEKMPPKISIEFPNEDKKTLHSKPDETTLKGKITGGVGQVALTIAKHSVNVNKDGSFSTLVSLKPGRNVIDIEVVDTMGNRDKQSWIIYNNRVK